MNPMIQDYLKKKYGIEDRQKIVDENEEMASGPNWRAGLAALGAGLSGQNAASAGMGILKDQEDRANKRLSDFDTLAKNESDTQSKLYELLQKKNESELKRSSDEKEAKEKLEFQGMQNQANRENQRYIASLLNSQKEKTAKNRLDDKKELADYRHELALELKNDSKKIKDQELLEEVENRRQEIGNNLNDLDKMVEEDGTYELFGPHNEILNGKLNAVATDTAKLFDPKSVARPSEVDQALKSLFQASPVKLSNDTARAIIKKYKEDIDRRAGTAYKVRGLQDPGVSQAANGKPKSIIQNGHRYILNEQTGDYE